MQLFVLNKQFCSLFSLIFNFFHLQNKHFNRLEFLFNQILQVLNSVVYLYMNVRPAKARANWVCRITKLGLFSKGVTRGPNHNVTVINIIYLVSIYLLLISKKTNFMECCMVAKDVNKQCNMQSEESSHIIFPVI